MACTAIAEVRYPPSAQLISGMSFYSGTCRCGWHRAPDPARDGQLITSSRADPCEGPLRCDAHRTGTAGVAVSGGRGVRSEEAVAGYRAGVGDVLADAAEPAAVAFACVWGRDRFDEAAQVFVGVRGSAAVALVLLRRGVDDLGGDGLDRAVVCRALAGGAVVEAAQLRGPRRDDGLAEQAADVGGDAGRIGPARRPLEQDLAGGALAAGLRRRPGRSWSGRRRRRGCCAAGWPGSKSAAGRPSIAAAAAPRIWLERSGSSATDCGAVPAASRISVSRCSAAAQPSAESLR